MDDVFVLLTADLNMCLEIPFSDEGGEFDPVELHAHCHGGESQLWRVGRGGRVVSALDPMLCLGAFSTAGYLGARCIRRGEPVVLVRLASEFALTFKWEDGSDLGVPSNSTKNPRGDDNAEKHGGEIICVQDTALRLASAERGHGIELQSPSRRAQTWTLIPPPIPPLKSPADPANSCILRYRGVNDGEVEESWTLQSAIDLKNCGKCVAGWGPGGYCAVDRIEDEKAVVAFSMWNINDAGTSANKVLKTGEGVSEDDSGCELKTSLEVAIIDHANEEAVFTVTGERYPGSRGISWRCSCWFRFIRSLEENLFIATYERIGPQAPLSHDGIHALLDWVVEPPNESPKVFLNGRLLNAFSVTKMSVQDVE